jgi:glutathione S-transferase
MATHSATDPKVVLWHIPISHYNEKARWALDCKRVPYELRTPMPGLHRISALRLTRGRHDRLPVIGIDGRRVGDSTAIIAALEELRPEPSLYPADRAERERALALEDYFDEELAPRIRRYNWFHTLGDADATIEAAMPGAGPVRTRLLRTVYPLARWMTARDYDIREETAGEAREGIHRCMDRLESELAGREYLVGDGFTVADLTAAALFTPTIAPPERPYAPRHVAEPIRELREQLIARLGGRWVEEMYRRHRGTSCAVPG